MSRSIYVVTALTLLLAATFVFAEQAGQSSSGQQQWQSSGSGSSAGQTGSTLAARTAAGAQRVATIAEQQNIDLYKAVRTAEQQGKGKAIAAVLMQPHGQMSGGSSAGQSGSVSGQSGAGGSTGQQSLVAHVFVATENQLQLVNVDPKDNKVLNMQSRQFIQNAWNPEASGTGGTSGSSGSYGSSGTSGTSGQTGSSGSTMGQGGSTGQDQSSMQQQDQSSQGRLGMLTLDAAQRIYRQAEQQNIELSRVIQTAEQQTKGKAVAAFLAMPGQRGVTGSSMGQGGSTSDAQSSSDTSSQQQIIAHVYTVADNQIKLAVVDAKANKVNNVETRQMLNAPWEGRMGTGGSTGGSYNQSGQGGSSGQSGQDPNSGPNFPTGSGSGSGPGSLGG